MQSKQFLLFLALTFIVSGCGVFKKKRIARITTNEGVLECNALWKAKDQNSNTFLLTLPGESAYEVIGFYNSYYLYRDPSEVNWEPANGFTTSENICFFNISHIKELQVKRKEVTITFNAGPQVTSPTSVSYWVNSTNLTGIGVLYYVNGEVKSQNDLLSVVGAKLTTTSSANNYSDLADVYFVEFINEYKQLLMAKQKKREEEKKEREKLKKIRYENLFAEQRQAEALEREIAKSRISTPSSIGLKLCKNGNISYFGSRIYRSQNGNYLDRNQNSFVQSGQIFGYLEGYSENKERIQIRMGGFASKERMKGEPSGAVTLGGINSTPSIIIWDDVKDWFICS